MLGGVRGLLMFRYGASLVQIVTSRAGRILQILRAKDLLVEATDLTSGGVATACSTLARTRRLKIVGNLM